MSGSSSDISRKPSILLAVICGISELKKQKAIWENFGALDFYEKQKKQQQKLMQELKKARAKKAVEKRFMRRVQTAVAEKTK